MKILILEDEVLVGIDLADTLESEGHEIMGPFTTASDALKGCEAETPDAALLDFNLGKETTSEPVADHLAARNVPFAFLTGYGQEFLPDRFEGRPIVEKPVTTVMLKELLKNEFVE